MGLTLASRSVVPRWAIAAALLVLAIAAATSLALDAAMDDLHLVEALSLEGGQACD